MNSNKKYQCPCCGYFTLDPWFDFEICEVCGWQNDPVQRDKPDYRGGANIMSLNEARENFKKIGAIAENYLDSVRLPTEEEKTGFSGEEADN